MNRCPAVHAQSGAIGKIDKQHSYMAVFQDITDTHECPVAIEIRKSKPTVIDEMDYTGTTALEGALVHP